MNNKTNTIEENNTDAIYPLAEDVKNSVLIVSLVVNLFVLTAWVALQVTTQFDAQLAGLLFSR